MVDGICQSYHWSFDQVMSLTMPQIILLNHAAWVNQERSDRRWKAKKEREEKKQQQTKVTDSDVVIEGRAMSEMTSEEIAAHVMTPW